MISIDSFIFFSNRISRGESQQSSSDVHFFTSHFMTTMKEKGPEAVASWTEKKNIDLFQKKLVFIPVNADLHWSLCVVVNPGKVANWSNHDVASIEEHSL
jgi:sentrin-specific protease 7